MTMFRYVKNNKTGATLIEYGLYKHGVGSVLYPVKQGFTELYKGLPSYNDAQVKTKIRMTLQRDLEANYYTTNNTRFD